MKQKRKLSVLIVLTVLVLIIFFFALSNFVILITSFLISDIIIHPLAPFVNPFFEKFFLTNICKYFTRAIKKRVIFFDSLLFSNILIY